MEKKNEIFQILIPCFPLVMKGKLEEFMAHWVQYSASSGNLFCEVNI